MVPLTAAKLLAPNGDLELAYFPDVAQDALEARVDVWLNEGYAKAAGASDDATKDDIARHYAYHKAYMAVYRRLSALPSSFNATDAGGHSYSSAQITNFLTLAEDERAEYEALIPVVSTAIGSTSSLPPTLATRSRVTLF